MNIVVLDLSTLLYERVGDRLEVRTEQRVLLGSAEVTDSAAEAVFRALDDALGSGQVHRGGVAYPVGFYNPYTAQVAVGAVPATVAYSDDQVVGLGPDGIVAAVTADLVAFGDRRLEAVRPSAFEVLTALSAHDR